MEQYVKQCIDARYNAFFNTYEIDDNNKKRIDELFNKINEFGESCKDPGEFEGKFNTSTLNDEYLELFSNIATTCKQKDIGPVPVFNDEEAEQRRIKHQTKRMIEEAEKLGADAVVGVRYGSSAVMQGAAEIIAFGTAVKFK